MRRIVSTFFFVALVSVPRAAWAQGEPVGPEFRVNTYEPGLQVAPAVATDSAGNFVIAWWSQGQDGSLWGIFGQRYAAGGAPLGPEFRVNTFATNDQVFPSIAFGGSGDFLVVWQSVMQDGSGDGIFGQRYLNSGTPVAPEFRVTTYTSGAQRNPSVAADAAGNFVVVWHGDLQEGVYGFGIFGQRYASSGAPLGPEFRVNTYTTGSQSFPDVAADSSGNFVVVWSSAGQDGDNYGIFGQRYSSSGAPAGTEFRVNTYTSGSQGNRPTVAADASGNFAVVWTSNGQDGSSFGVFGQRFASSGIPLGPEFRVNTYTTYIQCCQSVAADSSGNFVVVWFDYSKDGSYHGVFAQRFMSSGAPSGPEFRVNSYVFGYQNHPSVAADPSGRFVVAWQTIGQYSPVANIIGQRFGQIVPVELMRFGVE
jgi:hypothetical protein